MAKTRCKLRCESTTRYPNGYGAKLVAVYSGSDENESFSKQIPSATFELHLFNDQPFVAGREYYVDLYEAEGA